MPMIVIKKEKKIIPGNVNSEHCAGISKQRYAWSHTLFIENKSD